MNTTKSSSVYYGRIMPQVVLRDQYGFILSKTIVDETDRFGQSNIYEYQLKVSDELIIEVTVLDNIYSIVTKNKEGIKQLTIANRYKCDNESELNFLLLNGRIGSILSAINKR